MALVYTIEFTAKAEKELKKLPRQTIIKIVAKIALLANDPRPMGHKKLTNFHITGAPEELYRIRIGDYRVVYSIENEFLIIAIVKIAHRKNIYE